MFVTKIKLKNFRNYEDIELDLSKNINIFVGLNGQGKTNFLESIYVLAITKSHRSYIDNFLITKNKDFSSITGTIFNEKKDKFNTYQLILNKKGKKVSIDKKSISKISEYLGNINIVMFCPDDINLIKQTPNHRRKFLNIEICQLSKNYIKNLNNYNSILKIRNNCLKNYQHQKIDKVYFSILTDKLILSAIEIVKERHIYFNNLSKKFNEIYFKLTGNDNLKIVYHSFFNVKELEKPNLSLILKEKFQEMFATELKKGNTEIGIHREDFTFLLEEKNIFLYGSQGQQRIAILCLKLAEIEIFKQQKDEYPILLLDDIFSELDENNRNSILSYINNNIQTIITTTDLSLLEKNLLDKSNIYNVENGQIRLGKEE